MSVWVTPRTWTSTVVTAADLNGEIRDHLLWLKGFADIITATTAGDTGTATRLHVNRTATTNVAYSAGLSADTFNRFQITAAGKLEWGSGIAATDVSMERLAPNRMGVTGGVFELKRDTAANDAIITGLTTDTANRFTIEASGAQQWGDGVNMPDTELYRVDANTLGMRSGDSFQIVSGYLYFGPAGAPTGSFYEQSVGRLQTSQQFRANEGLITKVKAGSFTDADFTVVPPSGTIVVDTTNSRLYVRVGSAWKYVGLI